MASFGKELADNHVPKFYGKAVGFQKMGPHVRLLRSLKQAEERKEISAQHGPVRILVKDGKPVGQ